MPTSSHGPFQARRVLVLGDCADWVKNTAHTHFPGAQFIIDYHHVQHVVGTSWNANFDNPTNAQLATGSNFALAFEEPRLIPVVRLIVNSPYGGTI